MHICGVLGAVFCFLHTFMTPTKRLVRSEDAHSAGLAIFLWNSSIYTSMVADSESAGNVESRIYPYISLVHTRQNAGADAPDVARAYQALQISMMHTWPNASTDVVGAVRSVYREMSAMPTNWHVLYIFAARAAGGLSTTITCVDGSDAAHAGGLYRHRFIPLIDHSVTISFLRRNKRYWNPATAAGLTV